MPINRAEKSTKKSTGKKKLTKPKNRDEPEGNHSRNHPATTSNRTTLGNDWRREAPPSPFRVRDVVPIRDLVMKAKDKTTRSKEPKPKNDATPAALNSSQIDAREKAAEAALSRMALSSKNMGFVRDSSSNHSQDQMAVQSVLHVCPVVSQEILHAREWRPKIIAYLSQLSRTEPELAAVLTIHTLNSKEKVDECVPILTAYLKNIWTNPDEEKYRTIKIANRVFSEKVLPVKGAVEFLNAAGFREEETTHEGAKMDVLLLQENPDIEKLKMLIDSLISAEPVLPQVYRDPTVLQAKEAEERVYLPDDFYDLTENELKELYKKNLEKMEDLPLMTKAMREKEERKHLVKYKYTVVRIRFPDSLILQGTFSRLDTQMCLKEFVNSSLVKPFKYSLFCPLTKSVLLDSNDKKTLSDLKLVPSVMLNYVPEGIDGLPKIYLKPDLFSKIKKI